jgi:tripartite-type tricarboxylate transporter receptor subunit TctC
MRNAAWLFALLWVTALPCTGAEVYPSRPVHVIVPVAAGGTTDLVARVISQQLTAQLGQPFVVENRVGAGGRIATEHVAKSPADGYTLLLAEPGFTIHPSLVKSLPYDIIDDFAAITEIGISPLVLVVQPSLNVSTMSEFIALAKANPGKFNFGSGGVGSAQHLAMELFKKAADVNVIHVPFKGASEVMNAMLSGQIQVMIAGIPTVLARINSGTLRALAVMSDGRRSPVMPGVPSIVEAGLPGVVIYSWYGLVGPAGLPRTLIDKLHAEVVKAIAVPSVKERMFGDAGDMVGSSPAEFAQLIRDERRRWAEAAAGAGIVPE